MSGVRGYGAVVCIGGAVVDRGNYKVVGLWDVLVGSMLAI